MKSEGVNSSAVTSDVSETSSWTAAGEIAGLRHYVSHAAPSSTSILAAPMFGLPPAAVSGTSNIPTPNTSATPGASYVEDFGGTALVPEFAGAMSFSTAHGGGGGGSGTPQPYTSPTVNGLTFVIDWDSSVSTAPSGFITGFETAVGYFLANLDSPVQPITISLNVGWGEAGGQRLSFGALGESLTNIYQVDYSTLQARMASVLPGSDPIAASPHHYWVASAEEKALGLISDNTLVDGSLGFSSKIKWNFTTSAPASGQYDFISVAEHEISETMGRIALLGATISDNGVNYIGGYTPMDLLRFSAAGTRSLTGGQSAYFSFDNGVSSSGNSSSPGLTYFNSTAGGDWGDWQSSGALSAGNDAYDAFASSGVQYHPSSVDQTVMHVLGYGTAPAIT